MSSAVFLLEQVVTILVGFFLTIMEKLSGFLMKEKGLLIVRGYECLNRLCLLPVPVCAKVLVPSPAWGAGDEF